MRAHDAGAFEKDSRSRATLLFTRLREPRKGTPKETRTRATTTVMRMRLRAPYRKQAKLYRSGHNPSVPPPPRRGPANHRWTGGPKRPHLSAQHREWRQRVFERDNWTCVMCGRVRRAGDRVELQAHHVVPVSSDPSLALDLANGMTLCVECHRDHHWGVNRKKVG